MIKTISSIIPNLSDKAKLFFSDQEGGIVENAIIIGILAVVGAVALMAIRGPLNEIFTNIESELDGVANLEDCDVEDYT